MYALLLGGNAIVWILALVFFAPAHPLLLGTALLAYTFGLRHAVDADHICAIDNVTRKLMQEGKRPVAVGFFFSLGHSTIVVALTLLIVAGASTVRTHLPNLEGIGGIVGTTISATFLFVIAAINAFVLIDILRSLAQVRRGGTMCDRSLNESLEQRGLFGRLFKPLLRLASRSRDMYAIGLLFGLGFDTATEVGLLGIAAIEAGKGLPICEILIFPALFTAGMSLVDTTDGILMLGAYGWAFLKPARKLYYNLTITAASVFVAVLVGAVEIVGMTGNGPQTGWMGFAVAGLFGACWGVSSLLHRGRRYAESELSIAMDSARSNGAIPSAISQASKCLTYPVPKESASARVYDS
jgi:nickel/cobalt transporter (NiCoT) family protein